MPGSEYNPDPSIIDTGNANLFTDLYFFIRESLPAQKIKAGYKCKNKLNESHPALLIYKISGLILLS
ncbi:hypothetical protein PQM29_001929 [Morganella morganii]|uniref:hypothetical protein n=1 Tax=Morganella morganii TaxID=582 RepID=UPI00190166EC|nr:hypothetical protein [Morganella morganii]EKW8486111.1 hypothetical protein [Morganella morganii]HAT3626117.1 hypothetical protein [Morganella morganii]